ncbi:unnamed protein product [Rhizophagus irregularis]|nr:unnamed protein product [Rhizophagus irregularis]
MCNEVTPNPCQPTKAIVRLYRPAKVHTFCFHIKKLNPYVRCDTRGSGTLYNTSIGFHLACGHNDCPRPAASVSNRDRWRCNRHHEAIVIEHPTNPLTSVKTSIKSTSMTINTAAPKHDAKFHCNKSTIGVSKDVHLQRLGVSYTVTIRKYNCQVQTTKR